MSIDVIDSLAKIAGREIADAGNFREFFIAGTRFIVTRTNVEDQEVFFCTNDDQTLKFYLSPEQAAKFMVELADLLRNSKMTLGAAISAVLINISKNPQA